MENIFVMLFVFIQTLQMYQSVKEIASILHTEPYFYQDLSHCFSPLRFTDMLVFTSHCHCLASSSCFIL